MPATLAPELLNDVLRGKLGFNGVVITDATQMIGFNAAMPREKAIPTAIAAGCDMILFTNDTAEDMGYMRAGIENGTVTPERLQEAMERILGLKAKLGLTEKYEFPSAELIEKYVGCEEHHSFRREAAELCTTLVKDTQSLLPIDPKAKHVFLVYEHNIPNSKNYNGDTTREILKEELEKEGFSVELCPTYYDLEAENGVSFRNFPHDDGQGFP